MSSQPQVSIQLTRPGDGVNRARIRGDVLMINYTATLADGTVVDATKDRGMSYRLEFGQGDAINGLDWAMGRPSMTLGARAKIVIPSCFAYGKRGWPPTIPGDATLYFDVEVVGVNHKTYKSNWYEKA
ncbi:FKBP-like protein [Calocera viscosa TUFC12733]|uniref:peptidylprolyl isomerase n=1 Tax=Calocera viscosa (strain TUFC12733) TaxID=1330018 RepID=A0A167MYR3_CALVF|nr:FKBP-like protein [Calocera viscosa TUFC12733]